MAEKKDQKYVKAIANLLVMKRRHFKPQQHLDDEGKLIKIPTPSGENIAIKLKKAKNPLPGNPVLLFAHGDEESIEDFYFYESFLYNYGVSFCIMDFLGSGYSDGEYHTTGIRETEDCMIVIIYLKENGYEKISFYGRSLGGICGILIAVRMPDIVCLALDSPVIDFKEYTIYQINYAYKISREKIEELYPLGCKMAKELHNIDFLNNEPYEAAKKITQPIFVIHGTKDIHVPIENSKKLMEIVQSKEKKFIPFDGDHCSFNRYDYVLQQLIFILHHNGVDITEFKKEDEEMEYEENEE